MAALSLGAQLADQIFNGGEGGAFSLLELDEERSLPTLFSSSVLAAGVLMLGLTAWARHQAGKSDALSWALLGMVISAMSLDEHLAVHETLIGPLRGALDADGLLHFTWIVPGSIVAAGLVVVFAGLVRQMDAPVRRLFVIAVALFFSGALGVEALGGLYVSSHGCEEGFVYALITSFEETLEMLGSITFVYAVTVNLAIQRPPVRVGVERIPTAHGDTRADATADPARVRSVAVGLTLALVVVSLVTQLADVLVLHGRLDGLTARLDVATVRSVPTFLVALVVLGAGVIATTMALFSVSLGVVALGLVAVRFLLRLPRATWRLLAMASVAFLFGALGVELLVESWAFANGEGNVTYVLLTSAEEMLVLSGLVALVYGLLSRIREHLPGLTVHAAPDSGHMLAAALRGRLGARRRRPEPAGDSAARMSG